MDDNKNQWGPNLPAKPDLVPTPNFGGQNINRPAAPPPPPPEISVRTMKSDVESLRQTGGTGPTPKPFVPPELTREIPRPTPPPSRITPSDFTAPKPATEFPASKLKNIIEEEGPVKKAGSKKIVTIVISLIFAVIVAAAGYMYVFPLLFPAQPPTPPITTTPPAQPIPEVPTAAIPTLIHKSLLQLTSPVSAMRLPAIDPAAFKIALSEEAQKPLAVDSLTEVTVQDASGQVPASTLMPTIIPDLSSAVIANLFEEDYTIALYRDSNGIWPVYLLKLSAKASPVEAQTEISKLESSSDLTNLFLSDPGTPDAGFKSGQVAELTTRYLTYSQKGAGLNIAWSKNTLIVSTSYNGLKKAAGNLAK